MLLVDEGPLQREIDETGDVLAGPDGALPQYERLARGGLQQFQRLAYPLVGLVDLVEKEKTRDLQILQLAKNQFQLRDLAFIRLADDHRRVDGGQHRPHVM